MQSQSGYTESDGELNFIICLWHVWERMLDMLLSLSSDTFGSGHSKTPSWKPARASTAQSQLPRSRRPVKSEAHEERRVPWTHWCLPSVSMFHTELLCVNIYELGGGFHSSKIQPRRADALKRAHANTVKRCSGLLKELQTLEKQFSLNPLRLYFHHIPIQSSPLMDELKEKKSHPH